MTYDFKSRGWLPERLSPLRVAGSARGRFWRGMSRGSVILETPIIRVGFRLVMLAMGFGSLILRFGFVNDELRDSWVEYYFGSSFAKSWFEANRGTGEYRNKLGGR